MAASGKSIAVARPAATVVILRDGRRGLEVFMVVRHHEIDFASGALVFPDGKVDKQDEDPAWSEFAASTAGTPERACSGGARKTFEEAGLVLARRAVEGGLMDTGAAHRLVETYRAWLAIGNVTFLDVVRCENLRLATDLMVPFVVSAPVEQLGAHDGGEAVEGGLRPRRLCAKPKRVRARCCSPRTWTFSSWLVLPRGRGSGGARQSPIVSVMPRVERTGTGRTLHIPVAAG